MKIEQLVRAYRNGETLDSLAEKAGVSRTTLTKRLREHTAIRKPGYGKPKPRELGSEWDEVGRVSDTVLAEKIGCTRQNVAKVRKARGIPSFTEVRKRNERENHTDRADDV